LNIGQLLGEIRARKIELVADGERLRCIAPPGALTPELAAKIREAKGELLALLAGVTRKSTAGSLIPRTEAKGRFPLSFTQWRAVLAGRIAGALPAAFLLRGPLDQAALNEALRRIVKRHIPLRTRFFLDGETAEQEVLTDLKVDLPITDLSGYDDDERPTRMDELLAKLSRVEFDVRNPPLFRFTLVRLGAEEHVLHVAFNVLIFDGWSFDVFWQEMREGYAAISQGDPWPTAPLPVSYEDFVAWQYKRITEEIADQASFWKATLGDELPPLPLPTDRPRPRVSTARGKQIPFELPIETAAAVRRFAQQESVTPQITMLAALYALVARIATTRDLVVASPVDARTQPSIEGLIGPFVNVLLLRAKVDLEKPFADFLLSVRDLCLAAYECQEYPLERLDVRSPRSAAGAFSPAFQIEFSYQQVSRRGSHMGNLSLSQLELASGAATNDVTLWVKDWGQKVAGAVEFKADLFDQETIEHWVRCYLHLLRELIRNPRQPMQSIDLLGGERAQVLDRLARFSADPPTWALQRLGVTSPAEVSQWQVVDDLDQLRPLGVPGHLAILRDGTLQRLGVEARLRHDGALTEIVADLPLAAPKVAVDSSEKRSELETHLCLLFQELLGLPTVEPTQNYFELGGNSLSAVRLFGAIQEQFGMRLPIATLIDAGTPRALALTIEQQGKSHRSCAIRLKKGGNGPALFLIHTVVGETLPYRNLALLMPEQVTVYGIEPLRAGKITFVHTKIEDMARYYVEEIRKRQNKGPYFLGGLCAGGLIAFEVARQLEGYGEEIRHLALIESAPPQAEKQLNIGAQRRERLRGLLHDLPAAAANGEAARQGLQRLSAYCRRKIEQSYNDARKNALCLLLRHVFPLGENWPAALPVPTSEEVFAFAESEYTPAKLSRTHAVVYRATHGKAGTVGDVPLLDLLVDPLFGWQELFATRVEAIDVPSGHHTLLGAEQIAIVGRHLRASFEDLQNHGAAE
jgi:thioesterase domain-containing protein/acyl carrier protein